MEPRLIVVDAEAGDALVFPSVNEATGYMEPLDVDAGVYRTYDVEGRLMTACTDGNKVWVEQAETIPTHQDDLRASVLFTLRESRVDISALEEKTTLELVRTLSDLQRRCYNPLGLLARRLRSKAEAWYSRSDKKTN